MNDLAISSIELCAGVGMLGEGVRAAFEYLGWQHRTVAYVEREAPAAAQLIALMESECLDAAPVYSDLLTFRGRDWRGKVDCVIAGFPCQDMSVAGKRAGLNGSRSGLFFNVCDIADDCDAWLLILENVSGITSATATVVDETEGELEERAVSRVLGELADRGWNAEWLNLSASDVGASHGRERWFCFAWRDVGHTRYMPGSAEQGEQQDKSNSRTRESGQSITLADTESQRGRIGQRDEWPRGTEAESAGPNVGNTGLQHQHLQQRAHGAEHQAASDAMAYPTMQRAFGESGTVRGADGRPDSGLLSEFGNAIGEMANASNPRSQRGGASCDPSRWQEQDGHAGLEGRSLFAPGPSDERWAAIIAEHPYLAPAIESGVRVLVDGMAIFLDESRSHQLREVGNGVVALQAGCALVKLMRRAGIKRNAA